MNDLIPLASTVAENKAIWKSLFYYTGIGTHGAYRNVDQPRLIVTSNPFWPLENTRFVGMSKIWPETPDKFFHNTRGLRNAMEYGDLSEEIRVLLEEWRGLEED